MSFPHDESTRRHAHDHGGNGGSGHDHMHFQCCGEVFHGREDFQEHRSSEHEGEPYRCGCGEEFEELDAWITHVDEDHE